MVIRTGHRPRALRGEAHGVDIIRMTGEAVPDLRRDPIDNLG